MMQNFITINRWLARLWFVAMAGFILSISALWFWPLPDVTGFAPLPQTQTAPASDMAVAEGQGGRNIFDPAGQPWLAPQSKTSAAKADSGPQTVRGIMILPGWRGVITGSGFVAEGESLNGQAIQNIEQGKVRLNSSQGSSEIDINQERRQRLESLPITIH
jgi:hypothetical protein